MKRIRVLRIIARMNLGGPAIQIAGIAQGLDSEIFDHRLITGYCEEDELDYLDINPIDGLEITRIEGLGRSISIKKDLAIIFQLRKIIREWKPDIVHTHTSKAGFVGRLAALSTLPRPKIVHTYHGHTFRGYFSFPLNNFFIFIERVLAKFTDILVAVGSKVSQEIISLGIGTIEKFRVVPPGLNILSNLDCEQSRRRYELPDEKTLVGFVGRLAKIKRVDRFIEVVQIAKKRYLNAHFVVAGEGSEFGTIMNVAITENLPITFLGWVEDVSTLLPALDIIVLTSDNEGTPVSIIQAAFLGVPAIATSVGSVEEVIDHGKTGILTSNSPEEIYKELEKLVSDIPLRLRLSENAKEFAERKFSVKRLVGDYEAIYQSLNSR